MAKTTKKFDNFEFADTKYVLTDFENVFSFRQYKIAKQIMKPVFIALAGLTDSEAAQQIQGTKKINNFINIPKGNEIAGFLGKFLDISNENEILALIYVPENQVGKKFNLEAYKKRKELFEDLPMGIIEKSQKEMNRFFSFSQAFITVAIQTYSI